MTALTSSRIELTQKCLGSATLPHLNERNEFSDAGNERHEDREEAAKKGDVPEAIAARWPGFSWIPEVAYAYDISTGEGRELGRSIDRAYGDLGPFEVAGTADLIGVNGKGDLVVVDYKGFEEQAKAVQHPQVRFLALAAARSLSPDRVTVAIVPEVGPMDVAELDAFDLDETAFDLRQLMLSVAQAQANARNGVPVPFNTGRHCRWCPAFHACPKQSELKALVTTGAAETRVEMTMPFRDDETAADMYEFAKQLRILLKRVEAGLFARASERPIPLRSGKVFGPVDKMGNESIDGDIAYEVIRTLHGQAVADAAVERETSKKRIKEALGFVAGKGAVAAAERTVLEAIRAKGGTSRKLKVVVEEHTPHLQLVESTEAAS